MESKARYHSSRSPCLPLSPSPCLLVSGLPDEIAGKITRGGEVSLELFAESAFRSQLGWDVDRRSTEHDWVFDSA